MAIRKLSEKHSMELSTNETSHDMPIPEAQVGLMFFPFIGYPNFTFIHEVKYMKIVNIRYNIFFIDIHEHCWGGPLWNMSPWIHHTSNIFILLQNFRNRSRTEG